MVYGLLAITVIGFTALALSGCQIGYPFQGPGYDRKSGVIHPDASTKVLVVITQGDIGRGQGNKFVKQLRLVLDELSEHDGLIGYSVRRELIGSRVWTMSAWINRESLRSFTSSPAHRTAVQEGGIPREAFLEAYLHIPKNQVPLSWDEAKQQLQEQNF